LLTALLGKKLLEKNRFLNSHFPLNVVSRSVSGYAQIWEKQTTKAKFWLDGNIVRKTKSSLCDK
jgi:hypothetical protein